MPYMLINLFNRIVLIIVMIMSRDIASYIICINSLFSHSQSYSLVSITVFEYVYTILSCTVFHIFYY